jgi:hypothetical protein
MVGLGILIVVLLGVVATYVKGLDDMNDKYPDYKGEDLFNEDLKDWDITSGDRLEESEEDFKNN